MLVQIGQSLFDAAGSEKVAALVEKAKARDIKIVFPIDYVTADKFDKDAKVRQIRMRPVTLVNSFTDWPNDRRGGYP